MKKRKKPEYLEKTPDDEPQKMPHTEPRKFKPQSRLEPALKHWWQARKADVLTTTPRVAPNEINEKQQEDVRESVYLGSKMTTDGDCDVEINTKISRTMPCSSQCGDVLVSAFLPTSRLEMAMPSASSVRIRMLEDTRIHPMKARGLPKQVLETHPQNLLTDTVSNEDLDMTRYNLQ